jgi:hypothetical protein
MLALILRFALFAACCVVAWGGVACAEGKHFDTKGAGANSCAEYAKAYRSNPTQTDIMFGSWAQGYISGINAAMEDAYFGVRNFDETLRFLRKYCNDHPLANVQDAAMELLKSLPRLTRKDDASAPR